MDDFATKLNELKRSAESRSLISPITEKISDLSKRIQQLEMQVKPNAIEPRSLDIEPHRLERIIEDFNQKYERLSKQTFEVKDELRTVSNVPMLQGLRNKVDEIYGLFGDYYSKDQLKVLLDTKVSCTNDVWTFQKMKLTKLSRRTNPKWNHSFF